MCYLTRSARLAGDRVKVSIPVTIPEGTSSYINAGQLSPTFRRLNNELKSRLCEITLRQVPNSLEVVQALLVMSCYSDKGWLLTSLATRLAVDIGLHQRLRTLLLSPQHTLHSNSDVREARVWLGTVNLDHIFSLDSGKEPNWQPSDGVEGRRCRVLLDHPASQPLDARLFAQVELNLLRAHAHIHISKDVLFDADLLSYVRSLKLDANVWFEDWARIVEPWSPREKSGFLTGGKIIQCWAEIMICCKLVQHVGIENIDAMSPSQREIVTQAFESAREHLRQLLNPPREYLASFQFAMEFVHAKCAFSVLLLLKLSILLQDDLNSIVVDAEELLNELSRVQTSPNVYFKIMELSIAKARSALREMASMATPDNHALSISGITTAGVSEADSGMDLQTFVPNEFVFEWDFPGLTLFSRPLDFQTLFTDLAAGI